MSFGKLIYIVVFARLRQLAGQISKDAKDFLTENLGWIRQFHRLIPLLQKLPQEWVASQALLIWFWSEDDRHIAHDNSPLSKILSK